jgi:hypothetical protein
LKRERWLINKINQSINPPIASESISKILLGDMV